MNDGAGLDVREVCDQWGPVLERVFAERGITPSQRAGAPSQAEVLAAADEAADALRTILAEQQERDLVAAGAANEPDGRRETAARLRDEVSALVADPKTLRRLDLALVRIRAWSAQD
ncbi:MAG TPA: hypothetical protein VLX89_09710 [Actinomycetota bacterium]|nr:hypothetical protein [Actinomycetota bacterium]